MKRMKVLLQGYYGFGNLGDDILMKVTFNFARRMFPNAEIMIFSNEIAGLDRYVSRILETQVSIVNYSSRQRFDLIIHGGGGVHYDFQPGKKRFYLLNLIINAIGIRNYCKLYGMFKRLRDGGNVTTRLRVGIGIGVGSYTKSSEKFYVSISILGTYQYLLVRDATSISNARLYNSRAVISQSTDLAFDRESWTKLPGRMAQGGRKIGIVLRDWTYDGEHIKSLIRLAQVWRNSHHEVTFFFFEKRVDEKLYNSVEGLAPRIVWNPLEQDMDDFLKHFSDQNLIITTRFHGAIVAAAFGIPSIGLVIEPKLKTIGEMLPSVCLLDLPVKENKLLQLVEEMTSSDSHWSQKIKGEYSENSNRIKSDLMELEIVLRSHV